MRLGEIVENCTEVVGKVNVGRGVVARDGKKVIGLGCDEANVVLQVGW